MIIQAHQSPLDLILALHVMDENGHEVPRVVYLDTENMIAKQYLRVSKGDSIVSLKEIPVQSFEFHTTLTVTEEQLRTLLPQELHNKIVCTKNDKR